LIHRGRTDHPDFPDAISKSSGSPIGIRVEDAGKSSGSQRADEHAQFSIHAVSSGLRGGHRRKSVAVLAGFRPGSLSGSPVRFTRRRRHIVGRTELSRDDKTWNDDLQITYRRFEVETADREPTN
jgi:hypothetical protein